MFKSEKKMQLLIACVAVGLVLILTLPISAEDERTPSEARGFIKTQCSQATYIETGSRLISGGITYNVINGGPYHNGNNIEVISSIKSSKANMPIGSVLSWLSSPSYCSSNAQVSKAITGGWAGNQAEKEQKQQEESEAEEKNKKLKDHISWLSANGYGLGYIKIKCNLNTNIKVGTTLQSVYGLKNELEYEVLSFGEFEKDAEVLIASLSTGDVSNIEVGQKLKWFNNIPVFCDSDVVISKSIKGGQNRHVFKYD